jgi:hypothetical protein
MFAALIAIVLLLACVGAIYLLLRNMGQDGIEVAAPTSCKSGRCGVDGKAGCRNDEVRAAEFGELAERDARTDPATTEEEPRRVA